MSWSEVRPMAVKKAVTPKKKSSPSKPSTNPKAAPKKAAPKKSTQSADTKSKPTTPKKGAVKKAPALKLSDAQQRVLAAVHQTKEAGSLAGVAPLPRRRGCLELPTALKPRR